MTRNKKQRKKSRRTKTVPQPAAPRRKLAPIGFASALALGLAAFFLFSNHDAEQVEQRPPESPPLSLPKPEDDPVAVRPAPPEHVVDAAPAKEPAQTELVAGPAVIQNLSDVEGVDPLEDGWVGESINDQIGKQFNRLKQWLHSVDPQVDEIAEVVSDEFRCEDLRPSELQPSFESDAIVIHRADANSVANGSNYAGRPGFVAALRKLLDPLSPGPDLHAEFKVVSTDVGASHVETRILLHFHGTNENGNPVQINSVWLGKWNLSQTQPPVLTSLRAEDADFELAISRLPEGEVLSDCSQSVLGKTDAYERQLQYGVSHWVAQLDSNIGISLHDALGIAVGDVNGDELPDVYVCQSSGLANRLFLHQPDGTVVDASEGSGIDFCDHTGQSLFVDLDNDGDQDFVAIVMPDIVVMEGDGDGHFRLRSRYPVSGNGVALTAVDYDTDGLLDIYVCVRDDDPSTKHAQGLLGTPIPYHDANNGGPNLMLRNEGSLQFADVTAKIGLDQNNSRFSQAICWEDYDNDGDLDAYVANDFGRNNLYRNDIATSGKFVDVAAEAGVEDMSAGMSVSWADYDNDGWSDLYVGNMFSSAGNRVTFQRQFKSDSQQSTVDAFRRHARGNTLFRNRGDGTFEDVSEYAGVTMGRWAWASSLVDFNNDTWPDILVANGFITGYQTDDL